MNDCQYQELLEISWRRSLTELERRELEKFLAARPELRSGWMEDDALNSALRTLPDAPVPSNFAALIEQHIARETGGRAGLGRVGPRRSFLRLSLPRIAVGAILLGAVVLGSREYETHARLRMARSVAEFSTAAAGPKLEWLENFDEIHELRSEPPMDEDLYSLLRTVSANHQMRVTPPASNEFLASSP